MSATGSTIFSGLNPQQLEAVETIEGPLLIIAGAGSGKTRVVTHRIANLIEHGVRPWQILAITFTNKAAGEMRTRVEGLVGASGVWLSTFHSFCARLLRMEAESIGHTRDFTIYDEDDVKKLLQIIIKDLADDDKRFSVRNIRPILSLLKSQCVEPEDMNASSFHERITQQIYVSYIQALEKSNALDFDDLLLKGVRLLEKNEDIRQHYADRFRYILVDEYQDTNSCQYKLVRLLGRDHGNVCATGDPDQSIYSWRGADIENILSFERDFDNAKTVKLEQNYRSSKNILAIAGAVIKHNSKRKERELWTDNADGKKAKLLIVEDQEMEAHSVVSNIERIMKSGRLYQDFAIFYRTNSQSRPFETALINAAIPYQLVGGTPFFERKEVKDSLAYLRLIINPKDDVAFRRIINEPKRSLGKTTVDRVAAYATKANCSMLEALDHTDWLDRDMKPRPRKALYAFARMMDSFKELPVFPVAKVLRAILEISGLTESLTACDEDERLENLDQLVTAATVYDDESKEIVETPTDSDASESTEPSHPGETNDPNGPNEPSEAELEEMRPHPPSISGFLENAALVQTTDKLDNDHDRITLMTLHMAKGLEYPFVFLAGLEEGLLPLEMKRKPTEEPEYGKPTRKAEELEEERRLFYVGVTRAEEELYLLRAKMRMRFGVSDFAMPSQFLDEIPAALLETEGEEASSGYSYGAYGSGGRRSRNRFDFSSTGGRGNKPRSARAATAARKFDFADDTQDHEQAPVDLEDSQLPDIDMEDNQLSDIELEVGSRVRHAQFGDGTVLNLSGSQLSQKAQIRFDRQGIKLLLLSMAKLRIL